MSLLDLSNVQSLRSIPSPLDLSHEQSLRSIPSPLDLPHANHLSPMHQLSGITVGALCHWVLICLKWKYGVSAQVTPKVIDEAVQWLHSKEISIYMDPL
jgi:hypothetical protein